jgi:phosphoglycerol transferase MdoB-like AlkP superfamily enzyme
LFVKLNVERKPVLVSVAAALFAATTFSARLMEVLSGVPFAYSAVFLALVFCGLLPGRWAWLSLPCTFAMLWAGTIISDLKVAKLSLPLTYFDVRMAVTEPAALFNALGLNAYVRTYVAVAVAAIVLFVIGAFERLRRTRPRSRHAFSWAWSTLAVLLIAWLGQSALMRYAAYTRESLVSRHHALWLDLWLPRSQVTLAGMLGLPEYLAFSALAEREIDARLPNEPATATAQAAIRAAASNFVSVPPTLKLLPNIIIMHAESTFDPNRAFRLSSRVELPLWSGTPHTKVVAPLHVNIVGGGSWVTDFEVLTGVDSRLFGFQGYYTTYYVAPMVRYSFATYLKSKGYTTTAFSTVAGHTYNYKEAFTRYGFSKFIDGQSLGMSPDWDKFKDADFVAAIARSGAFDVRGDSRPFLYYVDTTENHGPHPCKQFRSAHEFMATYADVTDFKMNCELNEYLNRARSTSAAFGALLARLQAIETATGRPYVLLAYGDHQPWSFTDGVYTVAGGDAAETGFQTLAGVRTTASLRETLFHIVSSDNEVHLKKQLRAIIPPATLLPTLLSAYVASSYHDLYLPENFYLLQHCGSDVVGNDCAAYADIAPAMRSRLLSSARAQ